ncbi:MAG: helix-turn-helix domain-containing protein [Bacteroidales bacterium]|nr:helix-turn-helix domain-containing protein [Bacteroidales bacterium]
MTKYAILLTLLFFSFAKPHSAIAGDRYNYRIHTSNVSEINQLIVSYKDSIKLAQQQENREAQTFYNYAVSRLYYLLESYNNTIEYSKTALETVDAQTNYNLHINILNTYGSVYAQMDENEIAEVYFIKIDSIAKIHNDSSALAHNYINFGSMVMEEVPIKTLNFFNQAEEYISRNEKNSVSLIGIANNKGVLFKRMKKYDKAITLFKATLSKVDSSHAYYTVLNSNLASTYLFIKQNDSAIYYVNQALKYPSQSNYLNNYVNSFRILSDSYINKEIKDSASKYFSLYQRYNDSLVLNKEIEFVSKLKVIYEIDKHLENVKEKERKIQEYKKRTMWLSIVMSLGIIILIILIQAYRKLQLSYRNIVKESIKSIRIEQKNQDLKGELLVLKVNQEKVPLQSSIENSEEIFEQILELMEKEKLFIDEDFSLNKLAMELDTNRTYISNIINSHTGETFIQLVNKFRIKHAKEALIDENNKNLTIESIGKETGFKSTSTFNRVFKAETGVTPSFYVKNKNV